MTTQITLTTELQAINTMLSIIGEAPVSSITENIGSDVSIAKQILDESAVDIQSKGWNFNTEENYSLALDSDSKVPIPTNAVWVTARPGENDSKIIIRNGFLYDKENKTFTFGEAQKVDMIILLPFDELPQFVRRYITTTAGRRFQARYLGSKELAGFTQQDEMDALLNCEQLDAANEKQNILSQDLPNSIIFRSGRRRFY
ncbi:tail tubular protein A [uncultured phage_MedDCM-OCT-S28-C10]|uniref:Tail tubular protein A n=1 Tax=uncultured phage_MedDCM-OCT-S28-C10 TaxID=2741077 RepID=A0A6S4P9J1_9CAUD|nr:tail protein [uncultured phage_MedDCM-OCT-S28-C10]BAQ94045.1 tail tubular protein A [uncultured phage_MedDCM-OCT-S28-C10]BAR25342.1 tail tubular protein A [uncultured Mediterranean phage uvMED]